MTATFPSFILVDIICLRCCMILISRSHSSSSLFSCRDAFTWTEAQIRDLPQTVSNVCGCFWLIPFHKTFAFTSQGLLKTAQLFSSERKQFVFFFFQIQNTFVITTVAINMRHTVLMIIRETHQNTSKEDCKQTF